MYLSKFSTKQLFQKCSHYLSKSMDYERKFEEVLEEIENRQ